MLDDLSNLKEVGTKYGDLVKLVSGILGGVVALKMLLMPWVSAKFGESGHVVIIHEMKVVSATPGTPGILSLLVSKARNCKPHTVALTITDSRGGKFIAENSWSRTVLPMGDNQKINFEWIVPSGIRGGPAKAHLEAQHSNCKNGGQEPPPVTAEAAFIVYVE